MKAEMTLSWALGIILAALFTVFIVLPAIGAFGARHTEQSFLELQEMLDYMDSNRLLDYAQAITLYEDSFIVGFSKGQETMTIGRTNGMAFITRPSGCDLQKACICLCKTTADDLDDMGTGELLCKPEAWFCMSDEEFRDADLASEITAEDFFPGAFPDARGMITGYSDGFFLFHSYDGITLRPQPLVVYLHFRDQKLFMSLNSRFSPDPQASAQGGTSP